MEIDKYALETRHLIPLTIEENPQGSLINGQFHSPLPDAAKNGPQFLYFEFQFFVI